MYLKRIRQIKIDLSSKTCLNDNPLVFIMIGRKKKSYKTLWRSIEALTESGVRIPLGKVQVRCPCCGSFQIGEYGTHARKESRVETFQCKNPRCKHLQGHTTPKQFVLTSSAQFKELIAEKLASFFEDLVLDGAKQKTLAKKYGISEAQVSALRTELERTLDGLESLECLVESLQPDRAIAIDETFLKIERKSIYVILATGYRTHNVLGLKVSETRSESDLREVFDEADRNTTLPLSVITSDALNATQAMVKNLNREIVQVIHPHKRPFKRVIIRHYRYEGTDRITTTIGLKADFFMKRRKRQFRHLESRIDLLPKKKRKRGRPKGSKNKKEKPPHISKKKRGRKGLLTVFNKGTISYAAIDPYRDTLKVGKKTSSSVAAALNETLKLFSLMSIQNNLAEHKNSLLRSALRLSGPKTINSVERRIRALFKIRNNPELLNEIVISRNIQGDFLINNISLPYYATLIERGVIV